MGSAPDVELAHGNVKTYIKLKAIAILNLFRVLALLSEMVETPCLETKGK
jgi:hypothetical protein